MTTVTLVVPGGAEQAPISDGAREFKPYRRDHHDSQSGWLVDMPPEIAAHFLRGNSGFSLMTEQHVVPAATDETVRVKHAESPRSIGWGGETFEPDDDGVNHVPPGAVADAVSHGFRLVPDEPAAEPAPFIEPEDAEDLSFLDAPAVDDGKKQGTAEISAPADDAKPLRTGKR